MVSSLEKQYLSCLLQTLSDIGKCNCKGLQSGKRVLKVQCVGVSINSSKLHYLLKTSVHVNTSSLNLIINFVYFLYITRVFL